MRNTPRSVTTDPNEVKRLTARHPWATLVSPASTGPVVAPYPVLVDEADDLAIISHFGRRSHWSWQRKDSCRAARAAGWVRTETVAEHDEVREEACS